MSLIICENSLHHYNPDDYDKCPTCHEDEGKSSNNDAPIQRGTTPVEQNTRTKTTPIENTSNTSSNTNATNPFNSTTKKPDTKRKTTIISGNSGSTPSYANNDLLPVVGWLVVLSGAIKGKDFRLIQGENKIGLNPDMEVCLECGNDTDNTISRDSHAIIVYDTNNKDFFIERGSSRNMPTLNGKTVRRDDDLNSGDIIALGNTKLVFQAFVTDALEEY